MVGGASFRLGDEIRYIIRRAADHDGRIVNIGQLTLFSSETGDAWIIDRDDHLALRLARQGDPEPFHIEETDTSFAIDWNGHYRIEGAAFVFTDRDTGRITTTLDHARLPDRQAREGTLNFKYAWLDFLGNRTVSRVIFP